MIAELLSSASRLYRSLKEVIIGVVAVLFFLRVAPLTRKRVANDFTEPLQAIWAGTVHAIAQPPVRMHESELLVSAPVSSKACRRDDGWIHVADASFREKAVKVRTRSSRYWPAW